jgi:hypothetical protein
MNTNFEFNRQKLKQSKRLKAMVHILMTPQGTSEKSINSAANCMSGRNVPTDLDRLHNIELIKPKVRKSALDGSLYSVYQLKNIEQVNRLIKLIKNYCFRYKIPMIDQVLMDIARDNFERYFKSIAAKKD